MRESFQEGRAENTQARETRANELAALRASKTGLDCSGDDALRCRSIDLRVASAS